MQKNKNIEVSVVIGHFGHGGEVFKCLDSLNKIRHVFKSIEFILVDNNDEKLEKEKIKKDYTWVKYSPTKKNLGWGGGRNFGIKQTKGIYILSLDSDMVIDLKSFKSLYLKIKKNDKLGIISARIKNVSGKPFLGASNELTPIRGIFYLSFLNKIFPNNSIVKKHLISTWNRKTSKTVEVIQLGAFIIRKEAYENINGFDENIFLYFEENDVSKRMGKKGWKLLFDADSVVTHLESKGTPKETTEIKKVYSESRFYYFKKHYGVLSALLVEAFARLSKYSFILLGIFLLAIFLRFYRFMPNFMLSGEMGTDYMNIWNITHGTRTFLLGPRTSHEWFFISPIAYWIYTILLLIWKYNPIVINIFWGIIGSLSIPVCYVVIKKLFNNNIALISSFLMAVSPAWISQTRNSRYNLVVAILFLPYLMYLRDSINDKGKSLFKLGLVLGLTMSFFPSPLLLVPAVIVCFIFYKVRPKLKYILYSVIGFVIPNLAFVIYELTNKFSITIQLITWIPYRVFGFFGIYHKNTANSAIISQNFYSIYSFFAESFVGYGGTISIAIFTLITIGSIYFVKKYFRNKNTEMPFYLLIINLLVCYIGLFLHGNPPAHYYLVIFPIPLLLAGYVLDRSFKNKYVLVLSTLTIGAMGIFGLINTNWFYTDKETVNYQTNLVPYTTQLKIADTIYQDSNKIPLSLKRIGVNDHFENNFANNYIYLLTIRGAKIDVMSKTRYTIIEGKDNYQQIPGKIIFSENEVYVFKSQL
jgi:GT2 family glycosyltransferase